VVPDKAAMERKSTANRAANLVNYTIPAAKDDVDMLDTAAEYRMKFLTSRLLRITDLSPV
jgi:hypothetical protein